jgi:hypothetical protein
MANVPDHQHPEYDHAGLLVGMIILAVLAIGLLVLSVSHMHRIDVLEKKVEHLE